MTRPELRTLWCDFRIIPLGLSRAPRQFRQWAFNGKDGSNRGWHSLIREDEVMSALRIDGALVLRFDLRSSP
jgi:hypothetical protein